MAKNYGEAEVLDASKTDIYQALLEMTNGMGPDKCIDAVGAEAHSSSGLQNTKDTALEVAGMPTNHPYVLNEAIKSCRKGGVISMPGVYTDNLKDFAMGAAMNKALTFKMGQTHVQKYLPELLSHIEEKKIDPSFVITHKVNLNEAPAAYKSFNDKTDNCIKVVLVP